MNDLAILIIPLLINAAIAGIGVHQVPSLRILVGRGDVETGLPAQRINGVAAEFELLVGRRRAVVGIDRSAIGQAAAFHISAILAAEYAKTGRLS